MLFVRDNCGKLLLLEIIKIEKDLLKFWVKIEDVISSRQFEENAISWNTMLGDRSNQTAAFGLQVE